MKKKERFIIYNIWFLSLKKKDGYTLIELLCLIAVVGVIGVLTVPRFLFNQSSAVIDSYSQIKGILQQTRGRAISTTSAVRLKANGNNQFSVEIANKKGCEFRTQLRENAVSEDDELKVYSTRGFVESDLLKIGDDATDNEILSINESDSTIKLGLPLGTNQNADTVVELADNWKADRTFLPSDLTLPEKAVFTVNISNTPNVSNWTLCFDSRGIAYIFDNQGKSQPDLTFVIKSTLSNEQKTLTVLKGGAIKIEND